MFSKNVSGHVFSQRYHSHNTATHMNTQREVRDERGIEVASCRAGVVA